MRFYDCVRLLMVALPLSMTAIAGEVANTHSMEECPPHLTIPFKKRPIALFGPNCQITEDPNPFILANGRLAQRLADRHLAILRKSVWEIATIGEARSSIQDTTRAVTGTSSRKRRPH